MSYQYVDVGTTSAKISLQAMTRYVALGGSDTTGTGTLANPYLTIQRAARDYPRAGFGASSLGFRIAMVPPYTSAASCKLSISHGAFPNTSTGNNQMFILDAYIDPANANLTNDARWEILAGPFTPTAATTEQGRLKYTLTGAGLTEDQYIGQQVRIFTSLGVERSRGGVAFVRAATQDLLVQGTSTAFGTPIVPATTDRVYIVRPAISLTGTLVFDNFFSGYISIGGFRTTSLFYSNTSINGGLYPNGLQCEVSSGANLATFNSGVVNPPGVSSLSAALQSAFGYSAAEVALWFSWTPSFVREAVTSRALLISPGSAFIHSGVTKGTTVVLGDRGGQYELGLAGPTLRGSASVFSSGFRSADTAGFPPVISDGSGNALLTISNCSYVAGAVTSIICVETTKAGAGDAVQVLGTSMAGVNAMRLIPFQSGSPTMPTGLALNVVSGSDVRIDTASSTLRGAGSVDVKAGTNAAISYATLAGATDGADVCATRAALARS